MDHSCVQFDFALSLHGHAGLSIRKEVMNEQHRYFFQFHATDNGVSPEVKSNTKIVLNSEIGILFCPWCGTKLNPDVL